MLTRVRTAKVTWLNVKLTLEFISAARAWIDDDLVSALLVAGVLIANAEGIDQDPNNLHRFLQPGSIPDEIRRPVNALSIALSLGIPRETARIKIATLVDRGLLVKLDKGVILSSDVLLSEPFMAAMALFLRAIADFVAGLSMIEACGVLEGDRMATPLWSIGGIATRLVTAHVLRGIDHIQEVNPHVSLTTRYTHLALAHLTGSALRILSTMPKGGGRLAGWEPNLGPVTIAQLSRFVRLDDETVRRQVHRLDRMGAVTRSPAGSDINLSDPVRVARWLDFQSRTKISTRQLVWKLYRAGVIVRDPAHGLTVGSLRSPDSKMVRPKHRPTAKRTLLIDS